MKTWGDIFHKWMAKGYDPGYAAWMADKWQNRRKRMSEKLLSEWIKETIGPYGPNSDPMAAAWADKAAALEQQLAEKSREVERLFEAWYECPQDSVPDILQWEFIEIELENFLAGKKKAKES